MRQQSIFEIPHLRFLGRFQPESAREAGALPLFWTGSGVELCFSGRELRVTLEAAFSLHAPWVAEEVDGAPLLRTPLPPGESTLRLLHGLPEGTPRRIRLLRESQPMPDDPADSLRITSLGWEGGGFLPLPAPAYRLEFVGDSLTSGEGLFGARQEAEFSSAWFSAALGFPQRTADLLRAECRVVSQSGWGLRSDWCNDPRHALPGWYDRVCGPAGGQACAALGSQARWDFSLWQPDAVIVNLGTNDAGAMGNPPWQGPGGETFRQRADGAGLALLERAAADFLRALRAHCPGAKLVWAYGMLGETLRPTLEAAVGRFRRESGDTDAFYLPLPLVTGETMGAREHPGPACHAAAAETLAAFLKGILPGLV